MLPAWRNEQPVVDLDELHIVECRSVGSEYESKACIDSVAVAHDPSPRRGDGRLSVRQLVQVQLLVVGGGPHLREDH